MNYKNLLILGVFLVSSQVYSGVVPYAEDAYAMQAPQEIVALVQQAAERMGFDGGYEVAIPKKAGIEVNPWNKFITYGRNPGTQNPFILVNPTWFAGMPQEQQLFLLARCFAVFQEGNPVSMQIIPFLFVFLSFMLMFLIFWLLGKTALINQKKWVRAVMAWCLVFMANVFVLNSVQLQVVQYMNSRYDVNIVKMAAQKTGDIDAAVKAVRYFDASIKEAIEHGDTFFALYTGLFEKYALELAA